MIRIIAVGKIKDSHLVSLIEDYKKKINRYHKIEIVEVKDEPIRDNEAEVLKTEGERVLKLIDNRDYVCMASRWILLSLPDILMSFLIRIHVLCL